MGLKYYSNLIDLPIYSNQQSISSSSLRSDIYTSCTINKNIYANLSNQTFYENIQRHSGSSISSSPVYMNLNEPISSLFPVDLETNILAECSPTPTNTQTIEKFEVNIVSCTNDKVETHRVKIPRIPSSVRRRRTLNCPRRYRCRSSTPFRTILQSNATRRQRQKSSMIPQQQQQQHPSHKSVDNQLYQTIYPINDSPDHVEQKEGDGDKSHHRKSSSSTLVSLTNTIISSETLSSEDDPPRLSHVALSLDHKDVEFIHEILQRTHGDQRVSNRITALKQAYIRAANNRQEFLKHNTIVQANATDKKKATMKQSVVASKIRDELEKYDELPVYRKTFSDDDEEEEDEDTYSMNEEEEHHHHRYYHRRLPEIPSTTARIIDFLGTLKRQLQHNFQKIRSRILIEMMSNPPPTSRKRSYHHRSNVRPRSSSHYSIEHSYPVHRQRYSRSHSNVSQMSDKYISNRPRTFRVLPHHPQQQQQQRGRRMH